MKNRYLLALLFVISIFLFKDSYSQRIIINETFETSGFNLDSLPNGWSKDPVVGPNPTYPLAVWSVRDSGAFFPGVNGIVRSRAHSGTRGASIPWRAGNDVANAWMFTDSFTVRTGDSLMFWMLLGSPEDLALQNYIDTMQVRISTIPIGVEEFSTKLATIRSLDSNNVWTQHKFSLNQYAGQLVYIAFRYYMNTSVDGLWCNIDDIFVGNRSAVGITPIGTNIPTKFALNQNYPNPFNPTTKIKFDLPKNTQVNLTVYNTNGQLVMTLADGQYNAGSYEASFDAKSLPSGTYFYRLTTKDFVETKKMTLVK
jgi:hypothetical protein